MLGQFQFGGRHPRCVAGPPHLDHRDNGVHRLADSCACDLRPRRTASSSRAHPSPRTGSVRSRTVTTAEACVRTGTWARFTRSASGLDGRPVRRRGSVRSPQKPGASVRSGSGSPSSRRASSLLGTIRPSSITAGPLDARVQHRVGCSYMIRRSRVPDRRRPLAAAA